MCVHKWGRGKQKKRENIPSIKYFPVSPVSSYLLTFFPHQHINALNFTFSGLYFSLMLFYSLFLFSVKLLERTVCIFLKLLKSDFCPHHYVEIDHTKISSNVLGCSSGFFSVFFFTFTTLAVVNHLFSWLLLYHLPNFTLVFLVNSVTFSPCP